MNRKQTGGNRETKYKKRQLKKAKKLYARAEKREERTARATETFKGAGPKWSGVEPIFFTGKRARRRADRAMDKAEAGSRKAYRKGKKEGIYKQNGGERPQFGISKEDYERDLDTKKRVLVRNKLRKEGVTPGTELFETKIHEEARPLSSLTEDEKKLEEVRAEETRKEMRKRQRMERKNRRNKAKIAKLKTKIAKRSVYKTGGFIEPPIEQI